MPDVFRVEETHHPDGTRDTYVTISYLQLVLLYVLVVVFTALTALTNLTGLLSGVQDAWPVAYGLFLAMVSTVLAVAFGWELVALIRTVRRGRRAMDSSDSREKEPQ